LSPDGDDPSSPVVASMVHSVDGILDEHAQLALWDSRKSALLSKLVEYTNANGKWMYLLYQLGDVSRSSIEPAMANYLTMAGPKTAIYVSHRDDAYGYEPDFKGFDKTVGEPCGPAVTEQGVLIRRYSGGLAIFAPPGLSSVSLPIPGVYTDVDGAAVPKTIRVEGGEGHVLYTHPGDTAGCKVALQMSSH
jgi:hypothetical protein